MIIPKPKKFTKMGEIKVFCTVFADSELQFCIKAFKRIFDKIYRVHIAEGNGGVYIKYDSSLDEEEYAISGGAALRLVALSLLP